jgi:hypothetical protein
LQKILLISNFADKEKNMNTNKRNDAVKQNKAIKHSGNSGTLDALKAAENNKSTTKTTKG